MKSGMTSCPQQQDFDAVVAFLTQYNDKQEPTPSINIDLVTQIRSAKQQETSTVCGTFKGKIELKKYSSKEYESMSMAQH